MTIASRVKWYLESHDFQYEEMPHVHTWTSLQSAKAGGVFPEFIAKAVLLEDERGYVIAVLRGSDHISLSALRDELGREFELASEAELGMLFQDCEPGAVPPIGNAYGIPIVVEEKVLALPTVYFEAGDHEDLVSMEGKDFQRLMADARRCRFALVH
jgi:Ala-tRNA(Pro) deacylase